jgi:hypothetical protein
MTDELEAIRARHEAAKQALDDDRYYSSPNGYPPPSFSHDSGKRAHADRATLLRLLDAAREELKALKRSQALDELVAISQEAGLYDDPPPTRTQGESS